MSSIPPFLASALATSLTAQEQLLKPNQRLDNAISNTAANNIPSIAISPSQGVFLSILCKLLKAKSVLEIGTLGGYSTICLAESVPGIQVTSIEYDPHHHKIASENVKDLPNVDIRLGAALDVLPKLQKEGKVFDFVFIDADWERQGEYFDLVVGMTREGGCVYVDNVVRQLTESEEGDLSTWALIERVKRDERVDATLIPTLSTHKVVAEQLVDGFVLAFVK